MNFSDPVLARCDSSGDADKALGALMASGVDLRQLSVIGRLPSGRIDGARELGGALWSRLAGASVFALPRVGLVTCAGPIANEMTRLLDEGQDDPHLNLFEQALIRLGCDGSRAIAHGVALSQGGTLLLHHGDGAERDHSRRVLTGLAGFEPQAASSHHQGA